MKKYKNDIVKCCITIQRFIRRNIVKHKRKRFNYLTVVVKKFISLKLKRRKKTRGLNHKSKVLRMFLSSSREFNHFREVKNPFKKDYP